MALQQGRGFGLTEAPLGLSGWQDGGMTMRVEPWQLDPDCRSGKHGSCVGEPCQCDCHKPEQLTLFP